jgi:hypothetical protein
VKLVACILLSAILARHYGWGLASPEMAGLHSKLLGATAALVMLALIASAWRDRLVWAACGYGAVEYGQTAVCAAAYMHTPWPIQQGQPMCSAWAGADVAFFGLTVAAIVTYCLAWSVTCNKSSQGVKS